MEEEQSTFGLHKNINKAASIRAMCQTPGFKVLQEAFEEKIKKVTQKILDPELTDEEASKFRKQAQLWIEIEKVLKQLMLTGELSKRALDLIEPDLNTSDK